MQKSFLVLLVLSAFLLAAPGHAVGTGVFSHDINWADSGSLYYYITGGPASTCGDLWSARNGGLWVMQAAGWACTNASGAVTKGPWTWAGQAIDETAAVMITWPVPFGNTNVAYHKWDKTCSTTTIDNGALPLEFKGEATDVTYGAGFHSAWTDCTIRFRNTTTNLYWNPSTGTYSLSSPPAIGCTITGMPGMVVDWEADQVPSPGSHSTGQCYSWTASVTDGYCSYQAAHNFC